ncbi:hypothetical protein BZA77DRAFT_300769 [Pyronema omphalodes]|nr:hypothetical protein BZA77DRAFT_300769 [Pyronema omphalodes]
MFCYFFGSVVAFEVLLLLLRFACFISALVIFFSFYFLLFSVLVFFICFLLHEYQPYILGRRRKARDYAG